ncbi:signal transduction histidine kinase [Bacillus mesophilus]|uniref:histidine kinase n=1 Tax=Bacillus mesophilus TaxID=1808955 RepID=A0A6M0Q2Z2_9BACI|nr:sensor histidine kinase [Bacillus mesophilus]MBM7659896.1 signal transduction histidine kinase [Bacillus mesophilus]NEY70755.1 sensor histidine kinase [Bacillus mesophilus]
MEPLLYSHWGYRALFYTRIIWVLSHVLIFCYLYNTHDFILYLLIFGGFAAAIIPQLFWMKSFRKLTGIYPVVELFISGLFLLFSSYIIGEYSSYLAIPAMCAAAFIHTVKLRIILWIWFSITPAIVMAIVLPLSSFNLSIIEGFFFFALGCGVWKVIDTQQKMKHLLEENERQRRVLEEYTKQVETITLLEERNRMARELHDTVGHTLTSVIMGLDAVAYLINSSPEEATKNINQLRVVSRNGLEEVRNQIHHIVPSHERETLSEQLKKIANEFSLHTGTSITFEGKGPEVIVPLPFLTTLVRCLQESLTNAKRHGGATQIHITLTFEAEEMSLTIKDNGSGMDEIQFGFGLAGMKERLEAYQGELKVKSDKSGTMVICLLPIKNRKAG